MNTAKKKNPQLFRQIVTYFLVGLLAILAILFIPAWSFSFWQAWLYLAVLFIPMMLIVIYLYKTHPDLLERRMRYREPEKEQRLIIKLSFIPFTLAYIIPGLDFRFGWSSVPVWLVILSACLVFLAYLFIVYVFRINQYASRIVAVEKEQRVISTGPYSIVRHPMYFGTIVMYLVSPLALGSYWALIPALFIIPVIGFRLLNEEKILERDLPGYKEYEAKVKYHLLPGIW